MESITGCHQGEWLGYIKHFILKYILCIAVIAMAPFYHAVCSELKITEDTKLLEELTEKNREELCRLDHNIEDAQENLGETELKDALLERAEYLSKIGDKVRLT